MSFEAQSWAVQQTAGSPGAKALLLYLANVADVHGVTFAGRASLAEALEVRPATITTNLARLEDMGLLTRFERRRKNGSRTTDWTVLAPRFADRGAMRDASPDELPAVVAEAATEAQFDPESSGAVSEPERGSGAVFVPSQVRFSGGPYPSEEPSPSSSRSSKKKEAREHPEFGQWIGHHHAVTGMEVVKPGSVGRKQIASMFAARREEGFSLKDLELAVDGAWNDEFRRQGGYFDPESVLRPTKVAKLVAAGKRAKAAEPAEDSWKARNAARLAELSR